MNNYSNNILKFNTIFNTIFNIFIGILIAFIIYDILFKTVIYHGPDSKDIINKIYTYNGKKYKLVPRIYPCVSPFLSVSDS